MFSGKFGRRNGSSGNKRKSKKAMRAMNSIHHDKALVLNKADAIETKWQKINRNGRTGGETPSNKVDSWLHLVRDVLAPSRTSLNTIGEEEKRSSLPWRNRLSRASSVEGVSNDEIKMRSLPKRASYGGSSGLNIIDDNEEEVQVERIRTNKVSNNTYMYDTVEIEHRDTRLKPEVAFRPVSAPVSMTSSGGLRPNSAIGTPRISEEDARANSIESQSDSDQSETGSNSRSPSVTFSNNHEYITNYREAGSTSVPAPDDVFVDES